MKKIFAILLGLSVMSIVLAGCSGGGDADKGADAGKTPAEAPKADAK